MYFVLLNEEPLTCNARQRNRKRGESHMIMSFCQAQAKLFSDSHKVRIKFHSWLNEGFRPTPTLTVTYLRSYFQSGDLQCAKLDHMATAVEEIFRKMFSRDDDGLLIKFLCLFFIHFMVLRNRAVSSRRELPQRGMENIENSRIL